MKNFKNLLFYILVIGGCLLGIYQLTHLGKALELGKGGVAHAPATGSAWGQFAHTIMSNALHPLGMLLLQIIAIIIIARIFGIICKKIGQPTVIGEIVAGVLLGPSLLGRYFPGVSGFLFPADTLGNLQFLSMVGLILFMFVVGMELDLNVLKNRAHEAVVVSHASIVFPFTLGVGLAYFIYMEFAPAGIAFLSFALFMGISMSITAFPVLARVVQERDLTRTKVGTIAITCAAADDITAWCILAAVIAIVKAGSLLSTLFTISTAILYVFLMIKVVRPYLKRVGDIHANRERLTRPIVAIFFIILIVSSYTTELIGIHALFGAFMAGVIMPSNIHFRNVFIQKVEDVAMVLLLPLFFVFTGLRTEIGLINDAHLWAVCGVITLVAVVGKFWGSALAAKFVGQNWKDSLTIGSLMNTRGLMELVAINIGYDLGVLNKEIFAMLVIMALVTTFMTGPALDLINAVFKNKKPGPPEVNEVRKFNVMISFAHPGHGRAMLHLANALIKKSRDNASVTLLHLTPNNESLQFSIDEFERESFLPVKNEAEALRLPLKNIFKPSSDIEREIIETANNGNFDLLLIGFGMSVFEGTLLGRILGFTSKLVSPERLFSTIRGKEKLFEQEIFNEKTKHILKACKVPVGIFIPKNFEQLNTVFVPLFSEADTFLLNYVQRLIQNGDAQVTILDVAGLTNGPNPEIKERIRAIEHVAPNNIVLFTDNQIEKDFLTQQSLMIISLPSWKKAVETQSVWLTNSPSTLVIKS